MIQEHNHSVHCTPATPAAPPAWGAIGAMALCVALLIASEFMPVSLLTPIARDLGASEGMAGQAISISGLFAVATSLLIATAAGRLDRRHVLVGLTVAMLVSLALIAAAPSFGVLMLARALLGIAIGGFWSMSTATILRLVPPAGVPKALGIMYMGNAAATAFAAPLGSWVGDMIGWRGVFWALVPLAAVTLVWQWASLPSMPPRERVPAARVLALLRRPPVARAMAGVMLSFGGAFSAFTYFRPFLEQHVHATVPQLSLLLLALGSAGFVGTYAAGRLVNRHLHQLLRHLPLALGVTTLALLLAGSSVWALGLLLFAWGALNAAVPVAWFNWLTQAVPDEPEAGGGLMVAAIQLAIMLGAGLGGLLLDHLSIVATMLGGACLLALGSLSVGSSRRPCDASPRPQRPEALWPARPIRMGATQLALALPLAAAAADGPAAAGSTPPAHSPTASREQPRLWLTIGTRRFAVTLEDNATARAFLQLLPMTLDMPDLNGNEKHVRLPRSLPTQAERPGTLRAGDVMLYGSSTLVVFYETFDSGYSYTRIGRMADSAGLARALGSGSARITFTAP